MGRRKYHDLTIRKEPCDQHIARDVAIHLYRKQVVVWMPKKKRWKRGKLVAVLPKEDWFKVTWIDGSSSRLIGLWRLHDAKLFRGRLLPVPKYPAIIQEVKSQPKRRVRRMATKASTAKKGTAKRGRKSSNGSVNLRELSQAEKRKLASEIKSMRKEKVSWDEIKEELGLSSALQGRSLLREFGGENLIREQESTTSTKKKAGSSRKRRAEVDEDEDDDEDVAPRRRSARKKVTVKRGRGKSANPS